jgi:hypothetical protein
LTLDYWFSTFHVFYQLTKLQLRIQGITMLMNLVNLNADIRTLMIEEFNYDISRSQKPRSKRLTFSGNSLYPNILKEAIQIHDDLWLSRKLIGLFEDKEPKKYPNKTVMSKIPDNANEVLAEGDFNRFYMRALCLFAIKNNIPSLEIYSAKITHTPRDKSRRLLLQKFIDPTKLLNDLRNSIDDETKIGVGDSGSSLSVKLC